jgi:hypothetical protein
MYTEIELQALLLLAELELAVQKGYKVPDEVVQAMHALRQIELATKGTINTDIIKLIKQITKGA